MPGIPVVHPESSSSSIGVGFSDHILLMASVTGFCILAATVYSIVILRTKTREELEQEEDATAAGYEERLAAADVATLNRAQRRARAHYIMKQQRRAAPLVVQPPQDALLLANDDGGGAIAAAVDNDDHDDDNDNDAAEELAHLPQKSRKERQRAAKAAEREARRALEEERRQQQQEAQERAARERHERMAAQAVRAEMERKQRELDQLEQLRQEQLAWETFLSCENKSLNVRDWIDSLSNQRIANLEQLAVDYSTSSDVVRARIQTLIQEGRVAGVVEQDHFIHLTDDELQQIATAIQQAGTVSLCDVAKLGNHLIQNGSSGGGGNVVGNG